MNFDFKKNLLPHLIAVFLFWLATAIYFQPAVFKGQSLKQGDAVTWTGNAQEIAEHRTKYKEEPLWTNGMFGGMPAYTISVLYDGELLEYLENTSRWVLPYPVSIIFLSLVCFYIFCLSLRMSPVSAAFGAFAFTLFSFTIVSIEAGHNSKVRAMTLAPLLMAGMVYAFRGRWLWGLTLAALGTAMQIRSGHYQITYYLAFVVAFYGLSELIFAVLEGRIKTFAMACLVLGAGVGLGVASNAGRLMTLMEYSPYSMRGKPELTIKDANKPKDGGLNRDYVFSWSNAKMETFTLLIPHFFGGSSSEAVPKKSEIGDFFESNGQKIEQFPFYWGDQPFTSGPVYAGAVVCFLFVLGMFIVERRYKWWLFAATLFSIMLTWGRNFEEINYFLFDNFPGYNKFRAVTMAIFIAQFAMAALAALALSRLTEWEKIENLDKKLLYAGGIVGGLCLIFWVAPGTAGDFTTPNDSQITGAGYPADVTQRIMTALYDDRESMLSSDAFRSLVFVLLCIGLGYSVAKGWIKGLYGSLALAFLGFIDLWSVDMRYLNKSNFEKTFWTSQFQPSAADEFILKDQGFNNRVLNLDNPFNESKTSYFHKSIGGYSPVKIRRYQDLIENDLTNEIQDVGANLRAASRGEVPFTLDFLKNERILNMLNTKYIKANEDANGVITNPYALGNAWFVQSIKTVSSADEEMEATRTFDPVSTAIVDQTKFKVSKTSFAPGGTAKLVEAKSNFLKYQVENAAEGFIVFSEIYYAEGWVATIDGKEAPILRANYVLRALEVPAGKHEIVFKFDPASFRNGNRISLFSSIAILALLGFTAFWSFKNAGKANEENDAPAS
jgi:hypothetical protein